MPSIAPLAPIALADPATSALPVPRPAGEARPAAATPTFSASQGRFADILADAPRSVDEATVGQRFEAATLTTFVGQILPGEDSEFWGGAAGKLWRGLFAEHLAEAIADGEGVGIARLIDDMIAARQPDGPADASN